MDIKLRSTVAGGCVLTLEGCGPGAHKATARFLDPDYGPLELDFDGHAGAMVVREVAHGEVIVRVVDLGGAEPTRHSLSGDKPVDPDALDTSIKVKEDTAKAKARDRPDTTTRGAVTAKPAQAPGITGPR